MAAAARYVVDRIQALQSSPDRLRSVGICAHVDHGKTTLTDSLLAGSGLVDRERAGGLRATDTRDDEKARGITIKSTGATGYYELTNAAGEPDPYVLNLVDTPGHVDFSSEVTAALRVTDGAIVVVDCVEGVSVQTETVMRQALAELVRPALCINKVDRLITELQCSPEDAYLRFATIVERVNELIAGFRDAADAAELAPVPSAAPSGEVATSTGASAAAAAESAATGALSDAQRAEIRNARVLAAREFTRELALDPRRGNVVFASGKQGWAFSLATFARACVAKYGSTESKWMSRLWGDYWWDETAREFSRVPINAAGVALPRGFCHFVLRPIWELFACVRVAHGVGLDELLARHAIGVTVKVAERQAMDENHEYAATLEKLIRRWLPASAALVELAVRHLPSPREAQRYRTAMLYEGPPSDECARAMRECDATGPLMMFVSKMVPIDQGFMAFGRVFSGTLATGAPVRILGPDYVPGSDRDLATAKVSRVAIWMAARTEAVDSVPCGNTAGIQGIEKWLVKTGTITSSSAAFAISPMRMSVAPVVRVAIRPAAPEHQAAFREGIAKLARADSMVVFTKDASTGEDVMCGVGNLHLEVCLADLGAFAKVAIVASPPVVSYRETIIATSPAAVLKKSSNKHNRVFASAAPLAADFVTAVDEASQSGAGASMDADKRARALGMSKDDARGILVLGGPTTESAANMLVNASRGVAYVHEVSDSLADGFRAAVSAGPLCGEPLRGVRLAFEDGLFHSDSPHRAPRFVEPAARQAFWGAMLSAQPRLLEPVYLVTVVAPPEAIGAIFSVLAPRRGVLLTNDQREGSPLHVLTAHLPVATSFDFHETLLDRTSGRAFPSMSFSHWQLVDSDPYEPGSDAAVLVAAIRARKGLPPALPTVADFSDRL